MSETINRFGLPEYIALPQDRDGVTILPDDYIHLEHNDTVRRVVAIAITTPELGWLVYCDEGGGFDEDTLPEVTHTTREAYEAHRGTL